MRNAIAGLLLLCACWGGVGVDYTYADNGYPPDTYIATSTPIYYQGYPTYYWGGHWYWRDAGRWRYYRSEPTYLYNYRSRTVVAPPRAYYGRGQYYAHPRGGYRHHH